MNENLETSIDGLSTSCSSCCLSQNIIESLKQRIEKLESEMEKKNLTLENINLKLEKQNTSLEHHFSGYNNLHKNSHLDENASNVKQMEEKIQFLTEKTRDQQILLQQNFQFQQMQLTIIENKKLNNNDVNPFKLLLDNQKEEKLEALSKENKLLKEKCEEIEKKDLEKFNENIKLNKQLEELNIEMTKIKEEHQLTLTELSKYKKECQDLEIKYSTEKSQNKRRARSIREEFNQMKLENTNLINKLKESNEKINKNNDQIEELEQTNASLNFKIAELSSQLNLLSHKNVDKNLRFVNLPNKIDRIYNINRYVRVNNDMKIKYVMQTKENSQYVEILTNKCYIEEKGYLSNSSLFYFEVKMIMEQTDHLSCATIGVRNTPKHVTNAEIFLTNNLESINKNNYQKFSWNDGDIFGCGVVFPPRNEANYKDIYVFFTKNGNKIGSEILIKGLNKEYLHPIIGLLCCSVETNFGNDLVGKPFCYDISMFI